MDDYVADPYRSAVDKAGTYSQTQPVEGGGGGDIQNFRRQKDLLASVLN